MLSNRLSLFPRCFFDASKEFEHVSHQKLFEKRESMDVPMYTVKILSFLNETKEHVIK